MSLSSTPNSSAVWDSISIQVCQATVDCGDGDVQRDGKLRENQHQVIIAGRGELGSGGGADDQNAGDLIVLREPSDHLVEGRQAALVEPTHALVDTAVQIVTTTDADFVNGQNIAYLNGLAGGDLVGDGRSPVAALGDVSVVAQFGHQRGIVRHRVHDLDRHVAQPRLAQRRQAVHVVGYRDAGQ